MRKKIGNGVLLCGIGMIFFYILFQWRELNDFSNQSGLRYETGMLSGTQIEEYNEKQSEKEDQTGSIEETENEDQVEITAWKIEREQEIVQEELKQKTKGNVVKIYGNMVRVFPFSMKYGGFTFQEDEKGCVISSGLAWELFGAEDVVGNIVQYEGMEYQVRGVLDTEESILALYQENSEELLPYVEIWDSKEAPASKLEQIKSSLGLFGEGYAFHGSFYCSIARMLMSLPCWVIFFYFCRCFFTWCKTSESLCVKRYGKWYRIAGKVVLFLGVVIGIRFSFSFTRDFIPTQWSDFSFWSEKWKEIVEGVKGRGAFPEIYWEREAVRRVKKIAGGVLVCLFAEIAKNTSNFRKDKV